jgi:hypothetical protein
VKDRQQRRWKEVSTLRILCTGRAPVLHTCNPNCLEAEIRRIQVGGQHRQVISSPHLQNDQSKWTGGVSGSSLLCKCEALSSNPNPVKRILYTTYTNN